MQIHSFFILHNSGIPIYHKNFSEVLGKTDFTLLSSFFGAIMAFSSTIVNQELNILEMGNLRFFFRHHKDFIFIVITSSDSSALLLNERMDRIISSCDLNKIQSALDSNVFLEDEEAEKRIDEIFNFQDDYSDANIESMKFIFEGEISRGELLAAALMSLKGEIYYTSLPLEDLQTSLREIELRSKANRREIVSNPKFIWQGGDKMIFSQVVSIEAFHTPIYVVLLFNATTSLGMADFALEDILNKIKEHN